MGVAVRYSDTLTVRCQPEVTALVDRAAHRKGMKPSEYVRRCVVERLEDDGYRPVNATVPSGGSEMAPDGIAEPGAAVQRPATETNPTASLSQQTASEIA